MAARARLRSFTFHFRVLNHPQDTFRGSLDSASAYFGKFLKQLFRCGAGKMAQNGFKDFVIHGRLAIRGFLHNKASKGSLTCAVKAQSHTHRKRIAVRQAP